MNSSVRSGLSGAEISSPTRRIDGVPSPALMSPSYDRGTVPLSPSPGRSAGKFNHLSPRREAYDLEFEGGETPQPEIDLIEPLDYFKKYNFKSAFWLIFHPTELESRILAKMETKVCNELDVMRIVANSVRS